MEESFLWKRHVNLCAALTEKNTPLLKLSEVFAGWVNGNTFKGVLTNIQLTMLLQTTMESPQKQTSSIADLFIKRTAELGNKNGSFRLNVVKSLIKANNYFCTGMVSPFKKIPLYFC